MDTKKVAFFLAFSILILGQGTSAGAATGDSRYFVKSNSTFWKNSFGIRHQFEGGFTADLSDLELRMAKLFGIKIEPVKKIFILADPEVAPNTEIIVPASKEVLETGVIDRVPWGIESVYNNALLTFTSGGKGINVAVLDTGVFIDHSDISSQVHICKDLAGPKSIVNGSCDDENGHGTHVAGIIAADGGPNHKGLYGVAPESNLFIYRVCAEDGSCWVDDVAMAIYTAVDDGANIIAISIGGDASPVFLSNAVAYAFDHGVLVIAGAGNDGPYEDTMDYPAAYESVISVGAIDIGFNIPDWSSRGDNVNTKLGSIQEGDIEFVAPGVNIESTWNDGGYEILSGTSLAVPHVAGLAAKLWQVKGRDPSNNVRAILKRLSIDLDDIGEDNSSGYGFPSL